MILITDYSEMNSLLPYQAGITTVFLPLFQKSRLAVISMNTCERTFSV